MTPRMTTPARLIIPTAALFSSEMNKSAMITMTIKITMPTSGEAMASETSGITIGIGFKSYSNEKSGTPA